MPRAQASPESEQAVLAAVMSEDEAWFDVADLLKPEMFARPDHAAVAGAVWSLRQARKPVDPVTVTAVLQAAGRIPEPVPDALPFQLAAAAGTAANVQHYAATVRDLWAYREARRAAADLLNDESDAPVGRLIDGHTKRLLTIETGKVRKPTRIGDGFVRLLDSLEAEYKRPASAGGSLIPTGLPSLDLVIGGYEVGVPQLYAARPKRGKSALALTFARLAASRGVPTMVFWLEDSERMAFIRAAAQQAEVPRVLMRDGRNLRPEHWERLSRAAADVQTWPLWVDAAKGLKASEFSRLIRRYAKEYGIRLFLCDHLGEMKLNDDELRSRGDRDDMKLGEAFRGFRDATEEAGACGVVFHQLSREVERTGGKPKLSWLAGSGQLEQVARVVGYLDIEQRSYHIDILAQTHGPADARVTLGWDPDHMRIFQPEPVGQRSW